MRDDGGVECEVAREALSARIDGERQSVPAARVDEHVAGCRGCQAWVSFVDQQAPRSIGGRGPSVDQTRSIMSRVESAPHARLDSVVRWLRLDGLRAALVVVGVVQVGLAVAQIAGLHFGMVHAGPASMMSGDHLMNESTAWSLALGAATIASARWRALLPGLALVLGVFVVVLFGYVVHDAVASDVTLSRGVSHLPVVAAFLCAVAAHRHGTREHRPPANAAMQVADHDRVRSIDDSAA